MPVTVARMVDISYGQLFAWLCCPPSLNRIVSKMAFHPPEPSYSFVPSKRDSKLHLNLHEVVLWEHSERERRDVECLYVFTSRSNHVSCIMVPCGGSARYTILFSHGNHVDLGQMSSFFRYLGARIKCNVFGYDYSGYGLSSGKPSEKNVYADIAAAFHYLRDSYGVAASDIILFGVSIGTAPTVHLASRSEVGGVILQSGFTSAVRLLRPSVNRTWFFDAFPSIDRVSRVRAPVLFIHGTRDELIACAHSEAMHGRCASAVDPLWVEGGGHGDLALYPQYFPRLKRFVEAELGQ